MKLGGSGVNPLSHPNRSNLHLGSPSAATGVKARGRQGSHSCQSKADLLISVSCLKAHLHPTWWAGAPAATSVGLAAVRTQFPDNCLLPAIQRHVSWATQCGLRGWCSQKLCEVRCGPGCFPAASPSLLLSFKAAMPHGHFH